MKPIRHRTYIIAIIILFLSISRIAEAQPRATVLNFFIGDVKVWSIKDGVWKDARLKQSIVQGDSIRTGLESRAEVKLADGSVSRIEERSQIYIKELKDTGKEQEWHILLMIGKIWTNAVKLLGAKPARRVGTPFTLAAIRGTVYRVGMNEERTTEIAVYEGSVEVGPVAQDTAQPPSPPDRPVVALLPLAPAGISPSDAMALTNRLHTELLRRDTFTLVARDRVDELLKEQGLAQTGCLTAECISEAGTLLAARFVIAGSVNRTGQTYSMDVRRVDVETGLIPGFSQITSGSIDGLLEQMSGVAEELAPSPETQTLETGPRRVPGPSRVSYQEWMEILDAMQRIVVTPDGAREVSGFSADD